MKITLVPMRLDTPLQAERKGCCLILNGKAVDLSAATPDQPLAPDAGQPWILGEVTRDDGGLSVTLLLPHGADAPVETRFPAGIVMSGDGAVPLPAYQSAPDDAPQTDVP